MTFLFSSLCSPQLLNILARSSRLSDGRLMGAVQLDTTIRSKIKMDGKGEVRLIREGRIYPFE